METTVYKVYVFIPTESLEKVIKALQKGHINQLGNYKNCMSWQKVESTWVSLSGAVPYDGKVGKTTRAEEYKLEFLCEEKNLKKAVALIRKNHPYEEVEIDVIPMIYGMNLL